MKTYWMLTQGNFKWVTTLKEVNFTGLPPAPRLIINIQIKLKHFICAQESLIDKVYCELYSSIKHDM